MKKANWIFKSIFYKHTSMPLSKVEDSELEKGFYYPMPYIKQQHVNMCQDASEAMISNFYNHPFPSMDKNPRGIFQGARDTRNFVDHKINLNDMSYYLKNYGPFILNIPMKCGYHAVVCIGLSEKYIIYHDPLEGGNRCIEKDNFKKINLNENKNLISIAIPTSNLTLGKEFLAHKKHDLSDFKINPNYEVICIKNSFSKFFSINKKRHNPCENALYLLENFVNNSKNFSNEEQKEIKKEIQNFLEKSRELQSKDKLTIDALYELIGKYFSHHNNDEALQKRLQAIYTFIPMKF